MDSGYREKAGRRANGGTKAAPALLVATPDSSRAGGIVSQHGRRASAGGVRPTTRRQLQPTRELLTPVISNISEAPGNAADGQRRRERNQPAVPAIASHTDGHDRETGLLWAHRSSSSPSLHSGPALRQSKAVLHQQQQLPLDLSTGPVPPRRRSSNDRTPAADVSAAIQENHAAIPVPPRSYSVSAAPDAVQHQRRMQQRRALSPHPVTTSAASMSTRTGRSGRSGSYDDVAAPMSASDRRYAARHADYAASASAPSTPLMSRPYLLLPSTSALSEETASPHSATTTATQSVSSLDRRPPLHTSSRSSPMLLLLPSPAVSRASLSSPSVSLHQHPYHPRHHQRNGHSRHDITTGHHTPPMSPSVTAAPISATAAVVVPTSESAATETVCTVHVLLADIVATLDRDRDHDVDEALVPVRMRVNCTAADVLDGVHGALAARYPALMRLVPQDTFRAMCGMFEAEYVCSARRRDGWDDGDDGYGGYAVDSGDQEARPIRRKTLRMLDADEVPLFVRHNWQFHAPLERRVSGRPGTLSAAIDAAMRAAADNGRLFHFCVGVRRTETARRSSLVPTNGTADTEALYRRLRQLKNEEKLLIAAAVQRYEQQRRWLLDCFAR